MHFIITFLRKCFGKCHCCRSIYCLLCENRKSMSGKRFSCKRIICSLFCGTFFALLLWKLIMLNFSLSMRTELIILAAAIISIGIGFVLSDGVKCVILLIFVGIMGKSGRSYLRALSFALIISGPIENLATNGAEIVRVFACSTILSYNLTKTRFDLMTKPFQNTVAHMKDDVKDVEKAFGEVKNIVRPLHNEVEGDDDGNDDDHKVDKMPMKANGTNAKTLSNANETTTTITMKRIFRDREFSNANRSKADTIQRNYKHKFEKRCKRQLAKGKQRCVKAFQKAYDNCYNRFPRIVRTLLCWPYRVNFICKLDILGDPDSICDPTDAIPNDFGNNYVALDNTEKQLYGNKSVKVAYKVNSNNMSSSIKKIDQATDAVVEEFQSGKSVFDMIMHLTRHFLAFLFIRIIFASFSYYRNYQHNVDFDNLYITQYFKQIDQRRKLTDKRSILPLKKYEQKHLVDLEHYCYRTKEESREIVFQLLQFTLEMLTASFFLLLDHSIVLLLRIVRRRSLISYVQEGEHRIKFKISGKGLLARLLRGTLSNFNMHKHVSTFMSNEVCLPNPNVLPQSYYIKLMLLYFFILLLIFKSTTLLRLRRLICSHFYYKREKERILFLYNNVMRHRRLLFERMLKQAQSNMVNRKLRRRLNLLLRLRLSCTFACDWLRCFKFARRKCLICDQYEDTSFVICANAKCAMAYCSDCWENMHAVCVACQQYHQRIEDQ